MKRIISTVLILVMAISLVACGNTNAAKEEPETTQTEETKEDIEKSAEEQDDSIKSDKITQDTFILGVVGLEYAYKWKRGEMSGRELNGYMKIMEKKFEEIEPVDSSEDTAVALLGLYFGSLGLNAETAESSVVSEPTSQIARDSVDDYIDSIFEKLYKEEYVEQAKEETEKTGKAPTSL